jgi:uncharacterized protein YukE
MIAGAGFDVDPTRLRAAAPRFDAVADQLDDARSALHGGCTAEGPCWGGDQAGQAFAQSYLPPAEVVRTALGAAVAALRAIRAGLDESAATWEGAEGAAAGGFGGRHGGSR